MPHGHCYLWQSDLIALHVLSDGAIAASYTTIALTLAVLVRRRRDLPFTMVFWAFAIFIVSCGMTHLLEIWTLWTPLYWLSGWVKAVTATASLATAAMLIAFVPQALALPSPARLRSALEDLRKVEDRLRAAADGMMEGFVILTCVRGTSGAIVDFRIAEANPAMLTRLRMTRAEAIGKRLLDLPYPAESGFARYAQVAESRERVDEEISIQLPSEPAMWLHRQVVPLEDGVAVTSRDITERRRAEDNQARLASIVESTHDAIIGKSAAGIIETWNVGAERLYGYAADEVVGKSISIVVPADRADEDRELLDAVREGNRLDVLDTIRVGKDGVRREVSLTTSPIRNPLGELVGISTITRDISQQKRAARLAHADLLLKEVHHRVKNNLQVISSLLKLHAEQMVDPAAQVAFRDGQERVRAIALLHEHLHQSKSPGDVDIGDYTRSLIPQVLRANGRPAVNVEVEANGIALPADTAVPLGLILNELVSNAIKHAFSDGPGPAPQIRVILRAVESDYLLIVRDNGRGFPAGFDLASSNRLGMHIVKMLTRQLGGTCNLASTGSAEVVLRFPQDAEGEPS